MNKRDVLLIALVVLLAAGFAVVWPRLQAGQGTLGLVEARRSGTLVLEKALAEEGEYEILGSEGQRNTIRIEEGGVRMTEASCPDQLCVHQGTIRDSAGVIVCLPHRLVVRLTELPETPDEPDVIAR